jgi:hypothetical protein
VNIRSAGWDLMGWMGAFLGIYKRGYIEEYVMWYMGLVILFPTDIDEGGVCGAFLCSTLPHLFVLRQMSFVNSLYFP